MAEAITFHAVGTPADGSAFTTVIRAFALVSRLGDRLTLQGCGRRRSNLVKWTVALGVEHRATFIDGELQGASTAAADITLFLLCSSWSPACWLPRRRTIRVTANECILVSGGSERPHVDVRAGDVLGLCHAIHAMLASEAMSRDCSSAIELR